MKITLELDTKEIVQRLEEIFAMHDLEKREMHLLKVNTLIDLFPLHIKLKLHRYRELLAMKEKNLIEKHEIRDMQRLKSELMKEGVS